jgi:hypothetical protein
MSFLQLLKPAKRNLYEVLSVLPNKGVGARITRTAWAPFENSYFEITQVKLKDNKHGDAWGVKVWKGVPVTDSPTRVRGGSKHIWQLMPTADEAAKYNAIMHKLKRLERAQAFPASTTDSQAAATSS